MMIQTHTATMAPVLPRVTVRAKSDEPTMVDKIVDNTYRGANYTASGISGTLAGLGAYAVSAPGSAVKQTASIISNLWKTEVIGPNLKVIGTVAAAPLVLVGAAVGLPVSLISGLWNGLGEVDPEKPREFTIGAAAKAGFQDTRAGWTRFTEGVQETMNELGNEKLGEGEKPFDIPIIKTGKALAVGAAALAVGGAAGVVAAVLGAARESVVGAARSLTDDNLSIPARLFAAVGSVAGGVCHGAAYGFLTATGTTFSSIGTTWREDSLVEGAKNIVHRAASSVVGAVAPQSSMFQEKPTA